MNDSSQSRHYFCKKRILQDSVHLIKETIKQIVIAQAANYPDDKIELAAREQARLIQSICWNGKSHTSMKEFENQTIEKTIQFCQALRNQTTFPQPGDDNSASVHQDRIILSPLLSAKQ